MRPAVNSFLVAATVAVTSLMIGIPLGIIAARTNLPGRRGLTILLGTMLVVPLYLQAAGWDAAFGRQGWYSYEWSTLATPWFTGRLAVVWIHTVASVPWTAIIVGLGLQLVEPELEEQALLEAHPWQVLWHVSLPRAGAAVAAAFLWSMVTTAGEMTVADMYQVRTYAEEMYVGFALGDSLSEVTVRVIPGILITAFGVAAICALTIPWKQTANVLSIRKRRDFELGPWRWWAWGLTLVVIATLVGIPLASLLYKAGLVVEQQGGLRVRHWSATHFLRILGGTPRRFADEFLGTAILGSVTATGVMLLAIPLAWWARGGRWRAVIVWIVIATGCALPGPLVSLAVVHLLNHPDYEWLATLYDRTIAAPVLALIVRSSPLPLLVAWTGFRTIPREQLEAARLEGASPFDEFHHVAWPQRRRLLAGAWLLAAVLAAGDLSASILVTPPGFFTLPTRTFGLVHAGVDDQVAGLCLITLLGYLILAVLVGCLATRRQAAR